MPRKKLIRTSKFAYHVTTRVNNKDWFALSMSKTWDIALESLEFANKKVPIQLFSFVLMSNHYHLMLKTPCSNIDTFMQLFNKRFADLLRFRSKYINRMFGGPYRWSLVTQQLYFYNVYRYIYQNPIRAGLSDTCENYRFSTLYYQKNNFKFPVKIENFIDCKNVQVLNWLNTEYSNLSTRVISKGLRKGMFDIAKDRNTKKYPVLDYP